MLTWFLLGLALALLPPGGAARARDDRPRAPVPGRVLPAAAAAASAAAVLVVAGPAAGAVAAAVLAPAAWWLAPRLARRGRAAVRDPDLPFALDLVAAALRAGQPLSSAVRIAAPAAGAGTGPILDRVGRLLALGADPAEAWQHAAAVPGLQAVIGPAGRSAVTGIRPAEAFEHAAAELRRDAAAAGVARAERAGVLAVAPLGLCFLPAFVCLGIVPVVAGIARAALGHP